MKWKEWEGAWSSPASTSTQVWHQVVWYLSRLCSSHRPPLITQQPPFLHHLLLLLPPPHPSMGPSLLLYHSTPRGNCPNPSFAINSPCPLSIKKSSPFSLLSSYCPPLFSDVFYLSLLSHLSLLLLFPSFLFVFYFSSLPIPRRLPHISSHLYLTDLLCLPHPPAPPSPIAQTPRFSSFLFSHPSQIFCSSSSSSSSCRPSPSHYSTRWGNGGSAPRQLAPQLLLTIIAVTPPKSSRRPIGR